MANPGTVYFQPGEVTIILAASPALGPPPGPGQGAWRGYLDEANLRIAIEKLFADPAVAAPLHGLPFERMHGRGPRTALYFPDPAGTRILHTVNLKSWVSDPEKYDGRLLPALAHVKQVVNSLRALTPSRRKGKPYQVGPYQFLGAAPNWLTLPMQDFSPPGGPGGRPVPANTGGTGKKHPRFRKGRGVVADAVTTAVASTLTNAAGGFSLTGTGDGHNVRIALFDTWPMDDPTGPWTPGQVAQNGLGKIQDFRATKFNSSISRSHLDDAAAGTLVGPNHIFDYVGPRVPFPDPATPPKLDCNNNNLPKRRYDGADHGLFIAGILKDMAPQSEIVVYRVMDGLRPPDFHHVAEAMSHAASQFSGTPLVFNCSFSVGPEPQMIRWLLDNLATVYGNNALAWSTQLTQRVNSGAAGGASEIAQLIADKLLEPVTGTAPQEYRFTGEMAVLQELISTLQRSDILVVAAAGNDHCPGGAGRPLPRLPAAIEDVLGVSASVDNSGAYARYTNLDDFLPADDGIIAIGGDVTNGRSSPGLIGLFISEKVPVALDGLPSGATNKTGLARWSGTSFATPVAAGFAACLWSEMSTTMPASHAPAIDVLRGIANKWPAMPLEQGGWHL